MSAQEKANFKFSVFRLTKINDNGAFIRTLMFDGTAANFLIAHCLGANLSAFS